MANKAQAHFLRYTCSGVPPPPPRHRCLPPEAAPGRWRQQQRFPPPPPPGDGGTPALGLLGGPPRALCPSSCSLAAAPHTCRPSLLLFTPERAHPPLLAAQRQGFSCPETPVRLRSPAAPRHTTALPGLLPSGPVWQGWGGGGRATGACATAHPAHGEPPARPAPAVPAPLTGSTTAPFPVCVPGTRPFLTQLEVYRCYLSSSFI